MNIMINTIILACAWSGLAVLSLNKKHYVLGLLQIGIAIYYLISIYLYNK